MRREHGFSLVELLVATSIVTLILAATLGTLTSAINATQAITLMADTQENLRAGLNYMVRDFLQTGEGVPQGGITIPNIAGISAVNRPGPGTPAVSFGTFPTTWTALPAIVSGYQMGATTTTSGVATDMVTLMYADTTLQDVSGHWLNEFPIYLAPGSSGVTGCAASNPNPAPAGSITSSGTTVTVKFDPSCIVINNGNTGINPGDLIMIQNNNTVGDGSITGTNEDVSDTAGSMALMCVSTVNTVTNSVTFAANDPFNLNASGATSGTIKQIQTPVGSGNYPTTTATRFWLITYYISTAAPASAAQPMLMRQVNMNQPQAVGEVIENLQIFYDILNAGSSPVTVTAAQENPTSAQLPEIRDAYILLYARSQDPFNHTNRYFRNNLETVVSIRGLDFYNKFQ
ncbi:MAG TPA: prepilin-type N-terminal cleavage/methylation domain-containing protein [Candidatus Acidoferrales bacterium]|nr:prepilin-type N-terminal cleavage/methylation domain-containing protein [Candidatus Acidoferrales bacterium]